MPRRNRNEISRRLRREPTPEEKALWKALRSRRFAGFKFRRQHEVAPCFLDFYCPMAKLDISEARFSPPDEDDIIRSSRGPR